MYVYIYISILPCVWVVMYDSALYIYISYIFKKKCTALDIQTPAEVRYLGPKNIPKTPNLRRYLDV